MQVSQSVTCREFVDKSTDLLEGALPAELATTLGQHVEACTDCRRYMTQVEAVIGLAGGCVDLERASDRRAPAMNSQCLGQVGGTASEVRVDPAVECLKIDANTAQRFLEDELPIEEQLAVLEHLIGGCRACVSLCRPLAFPDLATSGPTRESVRQTRITGALRGRLEKHLRDEGVSLLTLWREVSVEGLPIEDYLLACIDFGRRLIGAQPDRALRLASQAVEIAESAAVSHELRARTLMFLGLATRRGTGDHRSASIHFGRANALLEPDGHPVLRAKGMELLAVNLYEQSRSDLALVWAGRAASILEEEAEVERLGRLLVDTACAVNEALGPKPALSQRFRASTLADFRGAPRYAFALVQGCALSYSDYERPWKALATISLVDRLPHQSILNRSDRLRLLWTEGRLLSSVGRFVEAAEILDRTREGLGAYGNPTEFARVSLEAALAHLELGNVGQAVATIGEALPILENAQLDQDATAATLALRQALAMGTLSLGAIAAATSTLADRIR